MNILSFLTKKGKSFSYKNDFFLLLSIDLDEKYAILRNNRTNKIELLDLQNFINNCCEIH